MEAEVHVNDPTNSYTLCIDKFGNAKTIDRVRNAINDGRCFDFSYNFSNVLNNGYCDIYIDNDLTIDNQSYFFKLIDVQSSGDFIITNYKTPALSNEGTALATYNFDSTNTETFPVAIKHSPTVTEAGTQISPAYKVLVESSIGSASAISSRGNEYSRGGDTDHTYLIRVQNVSGDTISDISVYGRVILQGTC